MSAIRILVVAATVLSAWPATAQRNAAQANTAQANTAQANTVPANAELLERAIFAEETAGDLDTAARIYEQLLNTRTVSQDMAAEFRQRLAETRRQSQSLRAAASQQATTSTEPPPRALTQSNVDAVLAGGDHDHANECCGTFTLNYDPERMVTVTGTVSTVLWQSPQSVLFVNGSDGNTWGFTLATPNVMLRNGVARDAFKKGDRVQITAYLATGVGEARCPAPLPNACATLENGALHASASTITSDTGQAIFNRKKPASSGVSPELAAALLQAGIPAERVHPVDVAASAQARQEAERLANRNLVQYYDPSRPMTVTGIVADVQWTDPRVVIFLSDSSGTFWGFTMNAPAVMQSMGYGPDSVKIGDRMRVSGYLAKGAGACPAALPNGCALLSNGARHAFAIALTYLNDDGTDKLPKAGSAIRSASPGQPAGPLPGAAPKR